MIFVHFQDKPLKFTVIQVYIPTNSTDKGEVKQFSEDLQDVIELRPKSISLSSRGIGMQK